MAGSMQKIAKRCFPGAMQVVDRFHVSKLVYEAVQDLRIAYRWQVMKDENRKIKEAKAKGESYEPKVFSNGDTLRQLLARSRYLLFKAPDKWLQSQKVRAKLLFEQFPEYKIRVLLRTTIRGRYFQTIQIKMWLVPNWHFGIMKLRSLVMIHSLLLPIPLRIITNGY